MCTYSYLQNEGTVAVARIFPVQGPQIVHDSRARVDSENSGTASGDGVTYFVVDAAIAVYCFDCTQNTYVSNICINLCKMHYRIWQKYYAKEASDGK